jgi:protein-tyrosine phosphatase
MPEHLTSTTHPIDVHFVPGSDLPAKGAIGFTLAPGRKGPGVAGLHDRDLQLDLDRLRAHHGINVVVSLVTDEEATKRTGIASAMERRAVEARGMTFHHLPVEVGQLPKESDLIELVQKLRDEVTFGRRVIVHDRAGGGRSAAVVSALLVGMGHGVQDAVAKVRAVRAKAVEPMQVKQLEAVAPRLAQQTSPMLQIVERTFEGEGWKYQRLPGVTLLVSTLALMGTDVPLVLTTQEAAQRLVVTADTKVYAPQASRAAVGELLHRLNWNQVLGAFDMDLSDGQVRYRVAIDVEGGTLAATMVKNMVATGVGAVVQFGAAIAAVANLGVAPLEALSRPRDALN